MEKSRIIKNHRLLGAARELRRNMTPQEKKLWYQFLRYYPVKIYKQRIINNFIVDFYCHQAKLVVELDGSQHYTPEEKQYDEKRTTYLQSQGLQIIRFSNLDVLRRFESVCAEIDRIVKENSGAEQV